MPYTPLFEHGNKRKVNVYMDAGLYDRIRAVAKFRGYQVSAIFRVALEAKLTQLEHDYQINSATLLEEYRKQGVVFSDEEKPDWTKDDE